MKTFFIAFYEYYLSTLSAVIFPSLSAVLTKELRKVIFFLFYCV